MTALASPVTAGLWTVDPAATRAEFRGRDLLRMTVVGTLPVRSGSVEVAPNGTVVRVRAELDPAGVTTGIGRRDHDLRGRRFFDVATSPVLGFTGGPARPRPQGGWTLPGVLVLRGVECVVELAVDLVTDGDGVRVRATTSLDRREIGIRVPRVLVAHGVRITVDAALVHRG